MSEPPRERLSRALGTGIAAAWEITACPPATRVVASRADA
jgi:hypothetical protein